MTTLYADLVDPVTPTDGTELFDRPTNCDVWKTPGFSVLRNIIYRGVRYADIGAACGCADLKALILWPMIYTNCQEHGVVEIGYLRREYSNGRRK